MATQIQQTCLLYGAVSPPVLDGFTVFCGPGQWLMATDGLNHYSVGSTKSHWLLYKVFYLGEALHFARDVRNWLDPGMADRAITKDRFTELATK